jgi:adenine specific DNA methylase Mod
MSSLLEKFKGGIDFIYIDPPFDIGADFKMSLAFGENGEQIGKEHSILEEVAFRDIWGRGTDSYAEFLYERLTLMRELLSEKGQIAVHCGVQVNHYVRALMTEIFGQRNEIEEIIWAYGSPSGGRAKANKIIKVHEYIILFAKKLWRT